MQLRPSPARRSRDLLADGRSNPPGLIGKSRRGNWKWREGGRWIWNVSTMIEGRLGEGHVVYLISMIVVTTTRTNVPFVRNRVKWTNIAPITAHLLAVEMMCGGDTPRMILRFGVLKRKDMAPSKQVAVPNMGNRSKSHIMIIHWMESRRTVDRLHLTEAQQAVPIIAQ